MHLRERIHAAAAAAAEEAASVLYSKTCNGKEKGSTKLTGHYFSLPGIYFGRFASSVSLGLI